MDVALREHLALLGFEPLRYRCYAARGGGIAIGTANTLTIKIGGHDFCITDLFVFLKNVGLGEGGDFRLRNVTDDYDYSNVISPFDTGTVDLPKIPYQTMPGSPSLLQLPWIVHAGDELSAYGFARFAAVNNFDVVLKGYELNTVGADIPYRPKWYHLNGHLYDLPATTFNIEQEVVISGQSDLICFCISSNWDRAVGIDVRETLENRGTGEAYTKRIIEDSRVFPRPYDTVQETVFPLPFKIPNGSTILRTMSNHGAVPARRPELTIFGYYDLRKER